MIPPLSLPPANLTIRTNKSGKPQVLCQCRHRFFILTPEEWVRQHFISFLINNLNYPAGLVAAEVPVSVQGLKQRADIVVFSREMKPLMIVECKAPTVTLSQTTLNQACRYLSALGAKAVVLTNGLQHYCIRLGENATPTFSPSLPTWDDLSAPLPK